MRSPPAKVSVSEVPPSQPSATSAAPQSAVSAAAKGKARPTLSSTRKNPYSAAATPVAPLDTSPAMLPEMEASGPATANRINASTINVAPQPMRRWLRSNATRTEESAMSGRVSM